MGEHRNPNLKNKAVFTQHHMIWGIPSRVFVGTLFLTFFSAFVFCKYLPLWIGIPASLVLAFVILLPVYLIHKEDPEAYIVWMRSLFAPFRLSAGRSVRRRVLILVPDSGGVLKVKPISQGLKK